MKVATLALLGLAGTWPAVAAQYQLNILSVTNTQPGQAPRVTFSVTDPVGGVPYNIKTDPAFNGSASRMNLQIGWDAVEIHNTGSGSELAATPAAAQPISANAVSASFANGDGTFTVAFTQTIPGSVTGTGIALLEARAARQDVLGAWSIRVPVKTAIQYFAITGASAVPRRQAVDRNRCNTCHTVLSVHGDLRTDELRGCVLCHNANATDIPYRQYGDGPESPLQFSYLVHSIHSGAISTSPFRVIGYGHSINDLGIVRMPNPGVANCEACHLPGTYALPISSSILGTTVSTQSVLTASQKTVDNNPVNNSRITPTAAVCSACHDDSNARDHMLSNGAVFDALQQNIASGAIREQCVNCHGAGKPEDLLVVHYPTSLAPRISALSVNSGLVNSVVPITITGANLGSMTLQLSPAGITASNVSVTPTQVTATLNIAANAVPGIYTIKAVNTVGSSRAINFNVVPPAPALTLVTPASAVPGASVPVTLHGTNLSGTTLAASTTAVTFTGVSASSTQVNATLKVNSSAVAGPLILTATTAGGLSNGVVFTVDPASAPPDFSVTPSPASRSITVGGSAAYTVTIAPLNGFNGSVAFTLSGLPAGVTAGFNPATLTGSGFSTLTLTTTAAVVPGTYLVTVTATSGSLCHTAPLSLTVTPPAVGGTLAGSMSVPVGPVQLTAEGGLDWAHWGLTSAADFDRKASAAQLISNFTVVGTNSATRFTANPVGYSWTGGTPHASATNSTTGVYVSGQNNGFRITVPADTTNRTLRVYVGVWSSQGRLAAELSDGSAPAYLDTSITTPANRTSLGVYTLTYRAASAGQSLSVTFTQNLGSGNVTLQAATLSGSAPAPDFSLAATPPNQSVAAGSAATFALTAAAQNGFSGNIVFSASGLPAGAAAAFSPSTVPGSGSSTITVTTTGLTPPGTYPFTITAASGTLVHTANLTLTVIPQVAGMLIGSVATPAGPIQLTAEGTLDWAHWGRSAVTDFDHKASVIPQISNFIVIGSYQPGTYSGNPVGFTWTDGIPFPAVTNTDTGVYLYGTNSGFQIQVPADTTPRTFKVYVGAWRSQGRLVAHLSDGSAVDYTDTSVVNSAGPAGLGAYTLTYRAASAGQTLTITYTKVTNTGNITLQAATLAP